jgi:hypothetical protein
MKVGEGFDFERREEVGELGVSWSRGVVSVVDGLGDIAAMRVVERKGKGHRNMGK